MEDVLANLGTLRGVRAEIQAVTVDRLLAPFGSPRKLIEIDMVATDSKHMHRKMPNGARAVRKHHRSG